MSLRSVLGFIITAALLIAIAPASLAEFQDEVRKKWNARQPLTTNELRDQWRSYLRGWWGYFRLTEYRRPIFEKEGWIRRHIRKWLPAFDEEKWRALSASLRLWQRWHSSKGREAALQRLGVPARRAEVGRSSRGAWRMARHAVVQEALKNKTLRKYEFLMPSGLAS